MSSNASQSAASKQSGAALQAAALQQQRYDTTRADLNPYTQAGLSSLPALENFATNASVPIGASFQAAQNAIPKGFVGASGQAALEQTPGYQFNLSQGLKALQNSNAAKGLGVSGNALRGAADFATGLANTTYQNQFNNQQTQYSDYANQFGNQISAQNALYNYTSGPASLGESAAAQTGTIGANLATQQGNNIAGAGVAQAAGDIRSGSSIAQGLGGLGYAAQNYANSPGGQSSLNGIGTGLGNWASGYNWNGTAGTSMMNDLSNQAQNNINTGAISSVNGM
jgi:hypothetical protein